MTAREWIERTFPVVDGRIVVSNVGDFQHYPLAGINPKAMPIAPVSVDMNQFLAWFGSAIDSALMSNTSIYAALTDGTVQDRGWRPYFELWKAKGIIS